MTDDLARLLQREIDASRNDIEMRTKLVRALAAYNEEIRAARDRLYADVVDAFGIGPQRMRPSLDDIQAAMNSWSQRN